MTYRKAVAVALLAASLVGCQPAPTPTTSGPSVVATGPDIEPTYECTPEFAAPSPSPSVRPTTCSRAVFDQMKARDAQYAEAERIYREFHEAEVQLARGDVGGEARLKALATPEVESAVAQSYAADRKDGYTFAGGDISLAWVRRYREPDDANALALEGCTDFRSARLMKRGKAVRQGATVVRALSFTTAGSSPRISNIVELPDGEC